MKKIALLLAGTLLLLTACEEDKGCPLPGAGAPEYIMYGTSFGECLGYCKRDIIITEEEIYLHKSGWDIDGELPEKSQTLKPDTIQWNAVVQKFNYEEFLLLDTVIGCPDCADGGAEWFEIKMEGKIHKVTFEYMNEPASLSDLAGYMRTIMENSAFFKNN